MRAGDRAKYRTLADIDKPGVRIAVNPGGTNQKFVNANIKLATVTVVEKNLSIPDLVATGQADVMITDGVEAALAAENDPRLAVADPADPFTKLQKEYFSTKAIRRLKPRWTRSSIVRSPTGPMQSCVRNGLDRGRAPGGADVERALRADRGRSRPARHAGRLARGVRRVGRASA